MRAGCWGFRELCEGGVGAPRHHGAPPPRSAESSELGMLLSRGGRWNSVGAHCRFGVRFRNAGDPVQKENETNPR